MPTTFNVISLGVLADMDTNEGNNVSENASALVGMTFGGPGNSLVADFASLSQVGNVQGTYDMDNNPNDQFSIDGGSAQTYDGSAVYNATITYIDGTTDTITAVIIQDLNGNTYLVPETGNNTDQQALEAGAIQSITLDSLFSNSYTGTNSNRRTWDYVTCFTSGTKIETPTGPKTIDTLNVGDLVNTSDHGAQEIRWIGSTKVQATGKCSPVVISKGALGNSRELKVSQQHRMLLSGWRAQMFFDAKEVLSPAVHLVNGDTIYISDGGEVEYFHMMFDTHEIIFAEGCPSESFYPGAQGLGIMAKETQEEIYTLFPKLRDDVGSYGPIVRTTLKGYETRALLS